MRVHRFLNKWGLINYQVRPQFKPGYALEKCLMDNQWIYLILEIIMLNLIHQEVFSFDTSRIPVERVDVKKLQQLMNESSNSNSGEVKQEKQPPPQQQQQQQQQNKMGIKVRNMD